MARVAAVVPDLFFASKVKETLAAAGHEVVIVAAGAPFEADVMVVDVDAAGPNFADVLARVGLYPDAPKPPTVMGYEVAGEIESVGPGADGFAPGQRVAAGTRFNGFAELAVADVANAFPVPDRLSFEE